MSTPRTLTCLLGLATMTALVLPASASACDARTRSRAVAKKPPDMRPPLIIGDSTMIFAAPMLARQGFDADAKGCRQFSEGVAMLAARRRAGSLPRLAVLALGANGAVGRDQIRRALRVAGRRTILGLVTPRQAGGTASAMRRAARLRPGRVLLIDWVRRSAGHGGWFGGDGLHVNHIGARAFTRLVRSAAVPIVAPPVRALRMPRTRTGAKRCGSVRRLGRRLRVYVARGAERILCRRARELARMPPLRPIDGWEAYQWPRAGHGPWREVYARRDRRVLLGLV